MAPKKNAVAAVNAIDELKATIERLHEAQTENRSEITKVTELSGPVEPVIERHAVRIKKLAEDYAAKLFYRNGTLLDELPADPISNSVMQIESFICFAMGDQLTETISASLRARWPQEWISDEDRARKLNELKKQLRDLEMEEEQICAQLEAIGLTPERRGDLDPAVYLGLTGDIAG